MQRFGRYTRLATVVAAVGGLPACESTLGVRLDAEADVSFQVAESGGGLFGGSPPNEVRSGGHVLVLTQATVTASRIALRGTAGAEHDAEASFDVPVHGGTVTPVRLQVEAGTFDELELRVRTLRLKGTYDGRPFDVTVRADAAAELELDPGLKIEAGERAHVTVRVDPRDWFRGSDGGIIDPARLNLELALRTRLTANLAASLRAG